VLFFKRWASIQAQNIMEEFIKEITKTLNLKIGK